MTDCLRNEKLLKMRILLNHIYFKTPSIFVHVKTRATLHIFKNF